MSCSLSGELSIDPRFAAGVPLQAKDQAALCPSIVLDAVTILPKLVDQGSL
jgi:hypothetical protein